ncbi:hypothetical protein [Gordonia bronchialis]|uniref:hypothetical protein n=1 Tax=Gordonia bronchialis TaxID=2054 RepID=UPI00226EAD2A|nr:hypothetical protein [Gordonia bronchialis]
MRGSQDSLAALRAEAGAGVDRLLEYLAVGRTFGMNLPPDTQIRTRMATIDRFDIAALAADSRCLVAAHRAVSEQLHQLPEQQIRLDRGWQGATATEAVVAVINHQRRAESDLDVLRTLTDATAAAASGIDRLLRTFLLAVARAGEPTVAGCPIAELPGAVLAGRVPMHVVIADIQARVALFTVGADAVVGGIVAILQILNRSTAGLDTEPYPADTRIPGHATLTSSRSDLAAGPDGTGIVTTVEHEHDDHRPTEKPPATAATTAPGPIESASARIVPTPDPVERGPVEDGDVPLRLGGTGTAATTGVAPGPRPSTAAEPSAGDLALAGDQ